MVRRNGAAVRKERIQEIARLIQRLLYKHGEISLSKTLATLEYEFGLTKPKLREYLGILEATERFTIDAEGDKIKTLSESDSRE